jgi:hypothetical protein
MTMKTVPFLYVTPAHRDSIGTILWDRHQGRNISQLQDMVYVNVRGRAFMSECLVLICMVPIRERGWGGG